MNTFPKPFPDLGATVSLQSKPPTQTGYMAISGDVSVADQWRIFAPVESAALPWKEGAVPTEIPTFLEVGEQRIKGVTVHSVRGQYEFHTFFGDPPAGREKVAYLFIELHATGSGPATLGFGWDWRLRGWLNGAPLFENGELETRGEVPGSSPEMISVEVQAGRNLLVLRLVCGAGPCLLAVAGSEQLRTRDFRPIVDDPMVRDPLWANARFQTAPGEKKETAIGSRRELWVDDFLIDARAGAVSLRLHHPVPREVVAEFGEAGMPWERNAGYPSLLHDGNRWCLFYSGRPKAVADEANNQFTCLMESADGIYFTRPELGLFEYEGTRKNNLVWHGRGGHNFTPFMDTRPGVPEGERFKAVAYHPEGRGLGAYASPDGRRWRLLCEQKILDAAVVGQGFDSQNLAFFDPIQNHYVCYFRYCGERMGGPRKIKRAISGDFIHWSDEGELLYDDTRAEQLYINGIQPYSRAPHFYLGTPARFVPFRWKIPSHPVAGVSDTIFMSSRDGHHFHRWAEGFLRPGCDPEVWTDRNNFCVPGFHSLCAEEISLYWQEHYRHRRPRIRRGTLRTDGFVSLHAPGEEVGEILTRPLRVEGRRLEVNYATSAIGSLRFEVCDESGKAFPGFSLAESNTLYGNEIAHTVHWRGGESLLPEWKGRPVRLRIRMQDADLFSFRFHDSP